MPETRTSNRRRTLLAWRSDGKRPEGWGVGRTVREVNTIGARVALRGRGVLRRTFQHGLRLVRATEQQATAATTAAPGKTVGWDGACRRVARDAGTMTPREQIILRARIDAILERSSGVNHQQGAPNLIRPRAFNSHLRVVDP